MIVLYCDAQDGAWQTVVRQNCTKRLFSVSSTTGWEDEIRPSEVQDQLSPESSRRGPKTLHSLAEPAALQPQLHLVCCVFRSECAICILHAHVAEAKAGRVLFFPCVKIPILHSMCKKFMATASPRGAEDAPETRAAERVSNRKVSACWFCFLISAPYFFQSTEARLC